MTLLPVNADEITSVKGSLRFIVLELYKIEAYN